MKICGACRLEKEEIDFNRKGDGLQSKCRECQRSWYKQYYDRIPKEKQRIQKKNKDSRNEVREKIRKIKEESPCKDCGNYFPYYVMDFDHQGDKDFTIANNLHKKSWSIIEAEIAKCEIVCANCHRIRTHSPLV